jgi:hypothetical protein
MTRASCQKKKKKKVIEGCKRRLEQQEMNIYPVLKKKKLIYTLSLNLKIYQLFLSQPINVKCITNRIPTRQPGMVGHTDSPKTQK